MKQLDLFNHNDNRNGRLQAGQATTPAQAESRRAAAIAPMPIGIERAQRLKINTLVNRYVFKEMIPPFSVALIFFTFVFLMTQILEITELIILYQISLFKILWLLLYSVPNFLVYTLPMSIMMAVLLAFLRLSSDNELIAYKTGGGSVYGLLPPVLLFALMGFLLTAAMTLYGMPWSRVAFNRMTRQVAAYNIDIGLKERTFNTSFKKVMLYVNRINPRDKSLRDVFIEDRRSGDAVNTVVAPKGKLYREPGQPEFHLFLYNGAINQVKLSERSVNNIHFDRYELTLNLEDYGVGAQRENKYIKERNLPELRSYLAEKRREKDFDTKYYRALLELHRKFAIPFACFVLALLAVPLGIQLKAARRSAGLAFGLVFFLLYYVMLAAGLVFGETGRYPPAVAMWLPNAVMGALAVFLLRGTSREKQYAFRRWPMQLGRYVYNRCAPAVAGRPAAKADGRGGSEPSEPMPAEPEPKFVRIPASKRFHRPGCKSLQRSDPKRMITYQTRAEAIAAGCQPCKTCNP
jgi:lipopolysaccharide export system permease protein